MTITVASRGLARYQLDVLRYLLSPYEIEIAENTDDSDLMITTGTSDYSDYSRPMIKVPTCHYTSTDDQPIDGGNRIVLPFDLITASSAKFESVMNPRIAPLYRLSTRLPLPYNLVPSSIRSRLLRMHKLDTALSNHVVNETYRQVLIDAFHLVGLRPKKKKTSSVLVTHDIETKKGLQSALKIKSVDDHLNARSVWFLPSDEYPIDGNIAKDLADGATIGSHDTKHDGTLIHVHQEEELVERLRKSRLRLERIFAKEVRSFRSPLLQSSRRILRALHKAGYQCDYSVPCWEPVHPSTMSGFGVECVQRFEIDGVTEIPLTLFQDHQVLRVLQMTPREAIKLWIEQARLVHSLGGDTVLLVHPDYDFGRNIGLYRKLVSSLIEIGNEPTENLMI